MGHCNTTSGEHYKPRQETEALHDGVECQLLSEESQEIRIYKDEHDEETVSHCGSLGSLSQTSRISSAASSTI
jgi:hypothetical protein